MADIQLLQQTAEIGGKRTGEAEMTP